MKEDIQQIKESIYAGMSIFEMLKNSIIKIGDQTVSLKDKKYLSLYLGLINTENKISEELKNVFLDLKVDYKKLDLSAYIYLYRTFFVDIIKDIDFNSIDNYFSYLLKIDIINKINENQQINLSSNKKLVKEIK